MVIVPDRLSDFARKGELTERYYNPGNLFDHVHIVMTNDDSPDPEPLQRLAGRAQLHLHRVPLGTSFFLKTLGWRPSLVRRALRDVTLDLISSARPQLIRCHGAHLNASIALVAKREAAIPYIVSLHNHPRADRRYSRLSAKERILGPFAKQLHQQALRNADAVCAVYESLMEYLADMGVARRNLAYNVVAPDNSLRVKTDYTLKDPVQLVSVSRQIPGKNPENIIRAMTHIHEAHLTLIGYGILHSDLKKLVDELGLNERVAFKKSMPNNVLCASLREYDVVVAHNDLYGIPKTLIESFLAGMPTIVNRPGGGQTVKELSPDICLLVDNSEAGYRDALRRMLADPVLRERLGRSGRTEAIKLWDPSATEARYASIYREVLEGPSS